MRGFRNQDQEVSGHALSVLLKGFAAEKDIPDVTIHGLQLASRDIRPGDLFVGLNGQKAHGLQYLDDAISRGCSAVVFDPEGMPESIDLIDARAPCIGIGNLRERLGFIADRFFGSPSGAMTLVAVTGTNGKTSCSHFLADAMSRFGEAGLVGTLGWGSRSSLEPLDHTTPDAIETHRILRRLSDGGYGFVAMEASSHGLDQGRLNGVRFKGALFTNFSRDHLDYHHTMEAYLEAKLRLLDWPGLEFVVFNADDAIAAPILARRREGLEYLGYAPAGQSCPETTPLVTYGNVSHHPGGTRFELHHHGESAGVDTPVYGDFNVANLAATCAVLLAMGYSFESAVEALGRARPVPGRMEIIQDRRRGVVVDYAHTPDALNVVLSGLRKHCRHHLWVVFGCGGDRDRGKRPEMGAVASRLADHVVITDDNPRFEDPEDIVNDILRDLGRGKATVIRDRKLAIRHALAGAADGDMVLVAGKGHEKTQEIQGKKYPFSDAETIADILREIRI